MSDDLEIPELTERDFKHMIRGSTRRRIMQGRIESGKDIVALRRFTKLSQKEFARALEISADARRPAPALAAARLRRPPAARLVSAA